MIYQNILITNLEDGVTTFMMTLDLDETIIQIGDHHFWLWIFIALLRNYENR